VEELFQKLFSLTTDPAQRLYWPFLISSAVVMLLFGKKRIFKDLLHPSSLLDVKLLSLNIVLKVFLFPLFLFSSFNVSLLAIKTLRYFFPYAQELSLSPLTQSILATLIAFVLNDFLRFAHHLLMHKSRILFTLHRTHHSALVLTPFTLFRSHPLESLMAGARNILSLGLTIALFSFLFKGKVNALDILGVNAFGLIFNAALANLRHSPLPISFGPLEFIFISPRMHQIHHSNNPAHFNKNYGVALSLWDLMIGTLYRPSKIESRALCFGLSHTLDSEQLQEATTLKGALIPQITAIRGLFKPIARQRPLIRPGHL
jgi:sterol desaturase/sphingolipid hydroxylase (fatty acid hydroxylase superfamily)